MKTRVSLKYYSYCSSSGTTDIELFVKIVNHCQLTGSKSKLCENHFTVHILIVIICNLNEPEKIFQGYRKKDTQQLHSNL